MAKLALENFQLKEKKKGKGGAKGEPKGENLKGDDADDLD